MWCILARVEGFPGSWCRVALQRPGVGVRVLACHAVPPDRMVEVVALSGPGWHDTYADIARVAGHVEVLNEGPAGATVRLQTPRCALANCVEATGLLPETPFEVTAEGDRWLIVAERAQASAFLAEIERRGQAAEVLYAGTYVPSPSLTERQRTLLEAAVREGYYDYPRRINLTRLAEKIGVAKSTLSEALMVVEREVVGGAVLGHGVRLPTRNGARKSEPAPGSNGSDAPPRPPPPNP